MPCTGFPMQKITPFLWFGGNAEEAVDFYVSTFPDSKILSVSRYGDDGPGPKGQAMVVTFQLAGQEFMALNGGRDIPFNEAVSLVVGCETQAEIDDLWARLTQGGQPSHCGWLKDRYGLSWQIVPRILGELMTSSDPERTRRVMQVMMTMDRLDLARLQQAHAGA